MEDQISAIECFPIGREEADDVDELKDAFPWKKDLRAVLESYFHIYDDFAEMSVAEFDEGFEKFSADMD